MSERGPGRKLVVPVKGMHCADCALNIQRSLEHVPGVLSAEVDYVTERAVIHYDPYRADPKAIAKAVTRPGYLVRETFLQTARSWWLDRRMTIFTVACGLFTVAGWAFHLAGRSTPATVLSLAALAAGGWPLLRNALGALLIPDLNTDTLVVIAAAAATAIGAHQEAATVVFIMLLGEFLEQFTTRRARSRISSLLALEPETALLKTPQGVKEVRAEDVRPGDTVVIKPGGRIPVDGEVAEGQGSVDTSTITGEPFPMEAGPGDKVYAGTVLVQGSLDLRALKTGEDTQLAQVKRLIQESQEKKAELQRIVDRFARYFIPLVFLLSGLTLAFTREVERAVTVLVVACPCALVLGTPTAVVAALGWAARRGVLVKGGAFLERLGKVDTLFLDKTGTLTLGKPRVTEVKAFRGLDPAELLQLAVVAEARSEHPLAEALLEKGRESGLDPPPLPEDFQAFPGKGVRARWRGRDILLGKEAFLREEGIVLDRDELEAVQAEEERGRTVFLAAVNGEPAGLISLSDIVRRDAARSLEAVRAMGIKRIALLTGDTPGAAREVASSLGVDEVHSRLLPEDKVKLVREAVERGEIVAMVGDGVNDAPALAAAHVGIAMGAVGKEVAVENADVALMTDDLSRLPMVVGLGRKTSRVIRQNIAFAVLFNAAMIGLSWAGWIPMVWGAVFHQVSSLGVILNSMRTRADENRSGSRQAPPEPLPSPSTTRAHPSRREADPPTRPD